VVNRNRLSLAEWREWGYRQVWNIPSVRANDIHSAMFPLELASRIVRLYSDVGDVVLDPFLGSGTTAIAAKLYGRHYIGIEKLKKYADLARRKIETEASGKLNLWQGTKHELGATDSQVASQKSVFEHCTCYKGEQLRPVLEKRRKASETEMMKSVKSRYTRKKSDG
jgi:hypothetical protein